MWTMQLQINDQKYVGTAQKEETYRTWKLYMSIKHKCEENLLKIKRLKHHVKKSSDVNNALNVAKHSKLEQIT